MTNNWIKLTYVFWKLLNTIKNTRSKKELPVRFKNTWCVKEDMLLGIITLIVIIILSVI